MKTVTLTDLRYHFPKVERLLRAGHVLQVTKRGKMFCWVRPEMVGAREEHQKKDISLVPKSRSDERY